MKSTQGPIMTTKVLVERDEIPVPHPLFHYMLNSDSESNYYRNTRGSCPVRKHHYFRIVIAYLNLHNFYREDKYYYSDIMVPVCHVLKNS